MAMNRPILVTDASPLVRLSAIRMIRRAFPETEVIGADRLDAALRLVRSRRPMMVITDIHLKKGSGLRLAEVVSERYPDTTVVVFTNEDGPEYQQEALKRGADFFISKAEQNGRSILDIIRRCPFCKQKS